MMYLRITEDIFETWPDVMVGVIIAHGLDNTRNDEAITRALQSEEARIPERAGDGPLAEHPHVAPWREAYRLFGVKPSRYQSSIENLIRRRLKGENLPRINPLVDLYNIVSLRYLLPAGGEDLDCVRGDIRLTRADENAPAVHLLGEPDARPPAPGEVIYTDDEGAICRRWNWKEAERTKLTEHTRSAVLLVERIAPLDADLLRRASDDLAGLVSRHCGGDIRMVILDRNTPETPLN